MDIQGKHVLVIGGYGLVGNAICRQILKHEPARLVVTSLRQGEAEQAAENLRADDPKTSVEIIPVWGDMLLRSEWQTDEEDGHPRIRILADTTKRRRLVGDIIDELDEEILESSLLYQMITGKMKGLNGKPADIVIDSVNTATAVAYQNVFATAHRLQDAIVQTAKIDWPQEVELLLTSLYIPQLVRHLQILHEAMWHAGTQAYVKVGTSGSGGMGFNIPYTHGEERPSRVLLSKSAVAGAQTMLTWLLARTPGGPTVVKEIKPTAAIAWKEMGFGPIRSKGQPFELFDCPVEMAYPLSETETLEPRGEFGKKTGDFLESVYIDTGENGLFAVGEFTAITSLNQMEFITPEEIAANVVTEILGGNTGRDILAALDSATMGPSYRAGMIRQMALDRLHQLEDDHDVDSVAFEILGPPRLSKLLFEGYLLKRQCKTINGVLSQQPETLAAELLEMISSDASLRQQILSIGVPILLPDGKRLMRGPVIKSEDAYHGWVDMTPANLAQWQQWLKALREMARGIQPDGASGGFDQSVRASGIWHEDDSIDVGEIAGWLFTHEDKGWRGKA
ncbi:MAG TPA: short-chain dehydrogenase [Anaerolineae bacterium]|nr:short-chain dehydrogenase [Anaerolineae bacterium]